MKKKLLKYIINIAFYAVFIETLYEVLFMHAKTFGNGIVLGIGLTMVLVDLAVVGTAIISKQK